MDISDLTLSDSACFGNDCDGYVGGRIIVIGSEAVTILVTWVDTPDNVIGVNAYPIVVHPSNLLGVSETQTSGSRFGAS